MSSLRNAVKRVTHKERQQPRNRQHLGLLEKKTDYGLRARDYHLKQGRLQRLREKASQRNPDEFYFGMKNAQVVDGAHRDDRPENSQDLGRDTIRLMKSQDLGYIRMQKQKETKKLEKLQASLHMTVDDSQNSKKNKRKHTIYVTDKSEVQDFDAAEHFDTLPELVGRSFNRPRKDAIIQQALAKMRNANGDTSNSSTRTTTGQDLVLSSRQQRRLARKMAKARAAQYREAAQRTVRLQTLQQAENHLVMEQSVQGKGRKRKIAEARDGQPAQFQWRRKRLR